MNEFEIIRRYFESKNLPVSVKLGVGDDGAIIHNDPALALKEASLLGSKIIMQKGAIVDVK